MPYFPPATGGGGGSDDLDVILAASVGEDIADALLGAAAPDSGNVFATMADVGGGGGGEETWLINVPMLMGSHGNTNWSTLAADGNEVYFFDIESSGAQNDEIYWDIGISAGTWTVDLMHKTGNNRGIYTVSIDGSSIGTVDGYNASAQYNQHGVITGVSIAAGKRRLKLKMATKNGSSSNYFGTAQHIQLRRTA